MPPPPPGVEDVPRNRNEEQDGRGPLSLRGSREVDRVGPRTFVRRRRRPGSETRTAFVVLGGRDASSVGVDPEGGPGQDQEGRRPSPVSLRDVKDTRPWSYGPRRHGGVEGGWVPRGQTRPRFQDRWSYLPIVPGFFRLGYPTLRFSEGPPLHSTSATRTRTLTTTTTSTHVHPRTLVP